MHTPDTHSAPLADLLAELPTPPTLGSRAWFPSLEARVYANHAAVSPASAAVQQAVGRYLADSAAKGLGAVMPWMAQRTRLRGQLARLVGAAPKDIALTAGTSPGILNIAMGFPWQSGDRVVLLRGEFPANTTPWLNAARIFGLQPVWVDVAGFSDGTGDGLDQVAVALERGARVVAVSAVQFQTGLRMPIEDLGRLCHAHGAALFVDAIQACGATPIDVEDVDFLASGGHKWLMGLEGAGFLYVSPDRVEDLRPALTSWLSHEDGMGFLFQGRGHLRYDRPIRKSADMFEASAPQAALFAALEGGLVPILALGVDTIFDHIQAWHDRLEPALVARGFTSLRQPERAGRSGSLCVDPPRDIDVVALNSGLAARGVSVAIPDGRMRFSPHWPNALVETDDLVAIIDEVLGELRR
jgi:cysteine desulfurase/selenocysteine lyase